MRTMIDVVMEVSVGVLAIIFLGVIVSLELYNSGAIVMLAPNIFIYAAFISFYVKSASRGIKKGGRKES